MSQAIAIVGMAGRFPGARNLDEFWRNLYDGVESIADRTDADLLASGVSSADLANPDYVRRASMLADVPMFDAGFFGISPRDASIMDPQHRHFLEVAWEALESAGHVPEKFSGSIGVFAGSGMNTYLIHNLLNNRSLLESAGLFQLKQTGNDKDVLATRVSYQFDLHGPAINVQTACSTSLVAIHLACQSLLNFECDMALAGGVTIEVPHGQGYVYRENEILSRDGRCRAFDRDATGTVFASGLGVVVLRRLDDALEDADSIRAVILGSAINNDGARKVGYLAPSVEGQTEVVAEALDYAGVKADEISYVETHGTGTRVGDPIEVRALTQAFHRTTSQRGYCGIGSLKPSVGHLDAAAGVAAVIKVALALEHQTLPASLNFESINPLIDLETSPFYVNNRRRPWLMNSGMRRAGVTSLGIGGTNAHLVLEQAPSVALLRDEHPWRLLVVSAKSESAADDSMCRLLDYLRSHPEVELADAAYTCAVGRREFSCRRAVVVSNSSDRLSHEICIHSSVASKGPAPLAFMVRGRQQYVVNAEREFYDHELAYRAAFKRCAHIARGQLSMDIESILYPATIAGSADADVLLPSETQRLASFAVQYALLSWWNEQGAEGTYHSGDAVGACVIRAMRGSPLADEMHRAVEESSLGEFEDVRIDDQELLLYLDTHVVRGAPHVTEAGSVETGLFTAMDTLGYLWSVGVSVDLSKRTPGKSAQRVALPTYPFEHKHYWIEADRNSESGTTSFGQKQTGNLNLYRRIWRKKAISNHGDLAPAPWMIFSGGDAFSGAFLRATEAARKDCVVVWQGPEYRRSGRNEFQIRATIRADYDAMLHALEAENRAPEAIAYLWSMEHGSSAERAVDLCFNAPLVLTQAITGRMARALDVVFVSYKLHAIEGEDATAPHQALLEGIARVLPKEDNGIHCRTVDVACSEGDEKVVASQLISELCVKGINGTFAYRDGERWQREIDPYVARGSQRRDKFPLGGVYLITGGLGALGLKLAEYLAVNSSARIVLTTRRNIADQSAWSRLAEDPSLEKEDRQLLRDLCALRAKAAGLLVVQADVANVQAMSSAIKTAESQFGSLDGVFHVAGLLDDAPIALKTIDAASRVLAPKVQGTLALEQALNGKELTTFVLFSSVSAITAPEGQVDYVAANAFLDAYAESRRGKVLSINWGAWREVGMSARLRSPHPWLQENLLDTPESQVYRGYFSQNTHWVLNEHRFMNGQALIPGTGYLELVAGAFGKGHRDVAVEFEDVYFLAPFMVENDDSRSLRVQLTRNAGHDSFTQYRFSVYGEDGNWTEHATGLIRGCTVVDTKLDLEILKLRCCGRTLDFDEAHRTRQERQLLFGRRWRSLRRLHIGAGEALAEIELDAELQADVKQLRQHPALLDMATGAAFYLTSDYDECKDLFLPISYHRMRTYRPLPARIYSHIRVRESGKLQSEIESFDVTVCDVQGCVVAEIEGFAVRRIQDVAGAMQPGGLARADKFARNLEPIKIEAQSGIATQDGIQAMMELLAQDTPPVLAVVQEDLVNPAQRIERTEAPQPATIIDGNVEEILAAWWQEMLGVPHVARDDDFFALGGHSLIGVRMFARIKRTLGVDLELASLFEARTVRQLGSLIEHRRNSALPASSRVWKSLVAIQPKGSKPPLFCVHAVGGDVLFYEQLARALGSDQPFYAFQSPLVADPDRRDLSIEQIAALYIAEMRAFYPHGPYLLGGASYGGFVVYEMARQLQQDGIEAGLIALFDVVIPANGKALPTRHKFLRMMKQVHHGRLHYVRRKAREKGQYFMSRFLEDIAYPLGTRVHKAMGWPLPSVLRFNHIARGHWEALSRYKIAPYPGKLTLISAGDRGPEVLGRDDDPTLGWGALAERGVEVIEVPTTHMHMLFEPYVSTFAVLLRSLLERGIADR